MTRSFCTLSDSGFLPYGLALYESLRKFGDDFVLYYLCTDLKAYDYINENEKLYPHIVPISLEELERECVELSEAKLQQPSYEAKNVAQHSDKSAQEIQYFWCLTSFFTWYCLEHLEIDEILYIDSDIFFFNDWNLIFEEIGNASIGIVRHRILPKPNPMVGEYNVGIVYFRNDMVGASCSWFWKNCLTGADQTYYKTHGMCGDQVYLTLFPQLFKNVRVIDEKVGHLAPWNFQHQEVFKDKTLIWQGKKQQLVYSHFSNFKPDYENKTYEPAPRHGLKKDVWISTPLRALYDEYFNACKTAWDMINCS